MAELAGKNIEELIAEGKEKIGSVPSGGGGAAAASAPAAGGAGIQQFSSVGRGPHCALKTFI